MALARVYPNLEGLKLPMPLTQAIQRAFQYIYDLRDQVLGTGKVTTSGVISLVDQTLTSNVTLTPPADAGEILSYVIRQDAAGGHTIGFDTNFSAYSASIDTTANTISTFLFLYSSTYSKYVMVGQPTTGMTA
jgi:hypothetical protein